MMKKLVGILMAFVFVGICNIQAFSQAGGPNGGGQLAGTWDALVTIRNCSSGNAITTFQSTANFNQGGTYTGITSGMPPALRSAEVGVWEHLSANRYEFRFKAYIFMPDGTPQGYQIVTHYIDLGDDNLSYVSAGTLRVFNMAGTQIGSGCSTAIGSRMLLN